VFHFFNSLFDLAVLFSILSENTRFGWACSFSSKPYRQRHHQPSPSLHPSPSSLPSTTATDPESFEKEIASIIKEERLQDEVKKLDEQIKKKKSLDSPTATTPTNLSSFVATSASLSSQKKPQVTKLTSQEQKDVEGSLSLLCPSPSSLSLLIHPFLFLLLRFGFRIGSSVSVIQKKLAEGLYQPIRMSVPVSSSSLSSFSFPFRSPCMPLGLSSFCFVCLFLSQCQKKPNGFSKLWESKLSPLPKEEVSSRFLPSLFLVFLFLTHFPTFQLGWAVTVGGRRMMTAYKNPLSVPSRVLAAAMATEWDSQVQTLNSDLMPLVCSLLFLPLVFLSLSLSFSLMSSSLFVQSELSLFFVAHSTSSTFSFPSFSLSPSCSFVLIDGVGQHDHRLWSAPPRPHHLPPPQLCSY
jgi:hypothetical protein